MDNLINIKNENGKQLVSAKELYLGLGLSKAVWSRWNQTNIVENDFFPEYENWIEVQHYVEGNKIIDYLISIEFAKHIAMMARTEKSHQYRNYFLKCEKQAKSNIPQLSVELQSIFALDAKTLAIDNRLITLEGSMTIDYSQQEELRTIANRKVVEILGGKDAPAYKECSKKAFSELWKAFKRVMHVNSYRNTATKEYEQARTIIKSWGPNRDLELMILGANSQIKINL